MGIQFRYFTGYFQDFCEMAKKKIVDPCERERLIKHEDDHRREGLKRRYTPSFALQKENSEWTCANIIYGGMRDEDIIAIAIAPKNPDSNDKEEAIDAWSRIQERRYFLG